ncbi:hypothetical protein F442_14978 [Phytophthora nicotianae P10297]|uniref:BZIP domain-containing protein n=1 Tax=Phytophthora nicotianae P10297 TaxID=1317064 RepID=W2YRF4_PHYNI|nr:hypothetical protein F442_14978 [Phytophthora nicotianae P10297]
MNFCTTRPPNSHNLRDDVIGNVNQRTIANHASNPHGDLVRPRSAEEKTLTKRKCESAIDISSFKSARREGEAFSSQAEDLVMLILEDQAKQRKLRRDRQRGYRQRQNDLMVCLQKETLQLQNEIQDLEERRSAIITATPTKENLWGVVVEYFRVFRFGVRGTISNSLETNAQLNFLQRTMTLDVQSNTGYGPSELIATWRRFSTSLQGVEIELQNLKRDSINAVVATIATNFTITEHVVQKLFPRLSGKRSSLLTKKLLHQEIVMLGTVRFVWDRTCGRITSVLSRSDMVTPMLELVGNVEELARVFEYARVLA